MSLSIANWRKVLDIIQEQYNGDEEAKFFLSADHDIIYFTCFEGVEPRSKLGKELESLGIFMQEDGGNMWIIYV